MQAGIREAIVGGVRACARHEAVFAYLVGNEIPLAEAVRLAFAGKLHNSAAITGVLATQSAQATSFRNLRPADAPEP